MPRTRSNLSSGPTGSSAQKGRNTIAQGNALGSRHPTNPSPEGVAQGIMPMIPLGRIAEVKLGKMLDKSKHTTGRKFPYLRNINVRWGRIDTSDLSEMFFKESEAERFSVIPGDVLVCEGGEPGRAAVWKGDHTHLKYQKALHRVRFLHEYEPRLLVYYLELLASRGELESRFTGSTIKHFTREAFVQLPVPNPPLPEQRRIVARIEELFSRLDAGVAALRHAKAQLQRYRQSVLAAAVTGALPGLNTIHPDSWQPISGVIKTLDQGWSPKCESVPAESDDEWAVIKTTAIQAGYFLDQENKKLPSHLEPRGHLELRIGDLLLTRAGPRSRVGVACYVRKVLPKLMLCDKAYRVRLEPKKATPGFIELVLNSPRFVDALDDMKSGISDSGLNLTQKRFAELLIPLPPLAEQHQIVAEVEARTTAIDHLEAELDRQITRSNRLRQSTLRAAFEGNLDYPSRSFIA